MTLNELKNYDGRDGRPAYVAVGGVIYDVSASRLWQNGDHEGAHQAGQDLTEELKSAPHVRSVVERFPVVGQLEAAQEIPVTEKKAGLTPLSMIIIGIVVVLLIATWLI